MTGLDTPEPDGSGTRPTNHSAQPDGSGTRPTRDLPQPDGSGTRPSRGDSEGGDRDPLDLARAIARGLAGKTPARRRKSHGSRRGGGTDPQFSGARADPRDPQSLEAAIGDLISEGGWSEELRVHGVFARWGAIVGAEVASHAQPISLADGRLEVRTDTTAWATQLRFLAPDLLGRLNGQLGDGTVVHIDVKGPNAPSWKKGKWTVKGRGPRDTYG